MLSNTLHTLSIMKSLKYNKLDTGMVPYRVTINIIKISCNVLDDHSI